MFAVLNQGTGIRSDDAYTHRKLLEQTAHFSILCNRLDNCQVLNFPADFHKFRRFNFSIYLNFEEDLNIVNCDLPLEKSVPPKLKHLMLVINWVTESSWT